MSGDVALPVGILERYGITARVVHRPSHAMLSYVYILDETWVLRGRPYSESVMREFEREVELMQAAQPLVPFAFPVPIQTRTGESFIVEGATLWTVHRYLRGRILGIWQENHKIPDRDTESLFRTLAVMHATTKGSLPKPRASWFARECRILLSGVKERLDAEDNEAIEEALRAVEKIHDESSDLSFIHGDFHHGNVLFSDDRVSGVIDCNWCRVGDPREDVAYTAMTYLRDFRTKDFRFDREKFRRYLEWYGMNPEDPDFRHFLILAAFWDFATFNMYENPRDREFYHSYQKGVVEALLAL